MKPLYPLDIKTLPRKISTVFEFLTFVKKIKFYSEKSDNNTELLFRGQNVDKVLRPKLHRLCDLRQIKGLENVQNVEKRIIDEFERGIIPLTEFKPENKWDILALAQHHSLPTRLLDWTLNPLVALWFAVCNVSEEKDNGVVWILNADEEYWNINVTGEDPFSLTSTKIFRPKIISRRISAQAGVFSCHFLHPNGNFSKFEGISKYKNRLIKIIILPEKFIQIRKELNIMGIHNFMLFPDLDGFCKHLEYKFLKSADEIQ
jgi:hypothetical protein